MEIGRSQQRTTGKDGEEIGRSQQRTTGRDGEEIGRSQQRTTGKDGDGGTLLMCLDFYHAVFPPAVQVLEEARASVAAPLIRRVVSGVSGSVSVVCLALTLLSYSLFSSLRSLPGLNNMGLSASLGLAQLSLLLPWNETGTKAVCRTVGLLTHWTWLQALGWMAVCCLHMARVFAAAVPVHSSMSKR
jgi:hypothetical protein